MSHFGLRKNILKKLNSMKKEKFWCVSCKHIFDASGIKKEWTDPIYGPCMKFVAPCPKCNAECDEYRDPNAQKKLSQPQNMGCSGCCNSCNLNH